MLNRPRISQLLAAVISALLLSGCTLVPEDLEPPIVKLVSVQLESGSFAGLRFNCVLQLDNPNEIDIPIAGGEFALAISDMATASGILTDSFTLPAKGSQRTLVTVTVDVSNLGVLAGETWNFQVWFRDTGTSNFTDATSITFQ